MKLISPVDWYKEKHAPSTNNPDFGSTADDNDAAPSVSAPQSLAPVSGVSSAGLASMNFGSSALAPIPAAMMPLSTPANAPAFDVAPPPEAFPTVNLNTTQAGAKITRDNYHWGTTIGQAAGPITFGFRTSAPTYTVDGEPVGTTFSAFTAQEQAAAVAALGLWASDANITFINSGNTNTATIEFANYNSSTDNSEAFAFFPSSGDTSASSSQGDMFLNTFYASTTNDLPGTYEFMTFIHELGHAIGLEHPGNYNAGPGQSITYANNAEYIQDSRQYSLMSYFDETNTGANFLGKTYDETPMLDDIAAVQRLYGANGGNRTGNTTYGFNSNAGSPYAITSASQAVAYTVYDAGGVDTLNFSGYSQSATINLTPESFSSVGGLVDNVSIAQNTSIENAVGGTGNDLIIVNPNLVGTLTGGGGLDTFQSTMSGLSQYTITDIGVGDKINFTDANFSTFSDHLSGTILTYGPAANHLTLSNGPQGHFTVTQDPTSGVDLTFVAQTSSVYIPRDFNGDSRSDIVWRNAGGDALIWKSNGSGGFTGQDLGIVDPSYQVAATGDFNGDDQSDILWRNTGGDALIWKSNGSGGFTGQDLGIVDPSYQVVGTGDFNGDGKADILWRNTGGDTIIWKSNASGGFTGQDLGIVDPSYQIAGVADFNGDGQSDILWRSTGGDALLWNSNGSGGFTGQDLGVVDASYHVAATADFNGDGQADVLWRNTSGDVFMWKSSNTSKSSGSGGFTGQDYGVVDNSYQIAGTGDFNGDGKADILWRNTGGDALIWKSNGSGGFTGQDLGVVDNSYHIQSV